MKAENWLLIKKILPDVVNLPPSERATFPGWSNLSDELKAEVESLISFEEKSADFMSVSAGRLTGELIFKKNIADSIIGQRIGVYEIVRELGFGGMGAVYLAERADGKFAQQVAVKMLKREFNSKEMRRSFEREKEIQSKLIHPNIARLLDAGTTGDGVPFLVMEFIEGLPIDEFCEKNQLELNARLKLFNKICEAVAFAHRNLIVHRDLKCSNILVDETGEPKLLDFGISKLLVESSDNPATLFGALTPNYASPEQIRGETITTATDIYSLGVVLFKMLTASFPYNFDGKTNGEVFKTITETEPFKPSSITNYELRMANEKQNPQFAIPNPKLLKGDLDNIVLKSISKEPALRYETVEQFSADVWRFIDNLPVIARPATFAYRAKKFYGRNKISVIAAVLIFSSLVTGIVVAFGQSKIAREQARIAEDARNAAQNETDKAKAEQEKSEKITKFVSKIIGYANPSWYADGAKFGKNARVIDAISDLSDQIDAEFAAEPDVAAELHHKFSEVFLMVGKDQNDSEKASKFFEKQKFHALRALELRKRFYGERHELIAKDLFYACSFLGRNDDERAAILMEAIQMMRETNPQNLNFPYILEAYTAHLMLPTETAELNETYRRAVQPASDKSKFQIAEAMLREALPVFRLHYKTDNLAIFSNECKLAYALAMQKKWADFDAHYQICRNGEAKLKNLNDPSIVNLTPFAEIAETALKQNR